MLSKGQQRHWQNEPWYETNCFPDCDISLMYIPYVQAAHLFRPDWFYYVTQRYLHSFQGRPRVSLRSLHAAHIHRRRAPVRYDANARHVGRASGRAVRSGDADYTADIADAATLDPIPEGVINAAIAAFCLEVIARHGEPAERLCNKDPLTLKSADYLSEIFPFAKFIFMVRDGRATVHSIISRKVTITGFDLESYRQCLKKWNEAISIMYQKCLRVGPSRCMVVYYEQLVLHPEKWLRRILQFFDLGWNSSVLHHEEMINKPGGVFLSKVERSSDQVIKPVNLEALTKWVGKIPEDVMKDMDEIAPMLARLGYDPTANPPEYGKPDPIVQDNTKRIQENPDIWEEKAMNLLLDTKMPEPSTEPTEPGQDGGGV
ncbi:hypothetical protein M8J76_001432 [Diaphorina citri]|nr:hypothetical protein M8J76_001432 [Diaphorina citri]